jgi:tetratricopeptide (TPR) repeat protein
MKRKKIVMFIVVTMMMGLLPTMMWTQTVDGDKELLEKAKLELFDRNWDTALKKLDQLLENFPDSSSYSLALFYKGRCLEEQKKSRAALAAYTEYLKISRNKSLWEEATIAIIDLNFQLYKSGEKQYLKRITEFLESKERTVRYYAAFKLSYAKEKKIAGAAVPVLKRIVTKESDEELVDRAKLALMRINPSYLRELSKTRSIEKRMFNIRIYHKKLKKETFSIKIPFALAKLALEALPDEEKELLKKKGYDLDRLLGTLSDIPEIIRIEGDDVIFKIWIE